MMQYRMKMNMAMRGLPSLCDRMNDVAVCDDDLNRPNLGAGGRIEIQNISNCILDWISRLA